MYATYINTDSHWNCVEIYYNVEDAITGHNKWVKMTKENGIDVDPEISFHENFME